jgi:esterase/lipase superfamily enzyme
MIPYRHRVALIAMTALLPLIGAGCESHSFYEFIPTPKLVTDRIEPDPFENIPAALQTPAAEVVYYTDRKPERTSERGQEYGYERSMSGAFGTMLVHFGPKDQDWAALVEESRAARRSPKMVVTTSGITELGRHPATPEQIDWSDPDDPKYLAKDLADRAAADEKFRAIMAERLAKSPDKRAFVFIHGYHCEFEWPAYVVAQLWHYMGRPGVAVAYSWPAARPGALRGYQYDRESGEFTVHHLKQFLKLLASCPDLKEVQILSHSRGTDVLTTALRELRYEYGSPMEVGKQLKIGAFVLAAADIDGTVATQRLGAAGLMLIPRHLVALYVSREDQALGLSTWMFDSRRRLGMMRPEDLRSGAIEILKRYPKLEVVDSRLKTPKIFSHSYFFAHPSGSSDLILLLRDNRPAGAAHGRPLECDPSGFWIMNEGYPSKPPATQPAGG